MCKIKNKRFFVQVSQKNKNIGRFYYLCYLWSKDAQVRKQ